MITFPLGLLRYMFVGKDNGHHRKNFTASVYLTAASRSLLLKNLLCIERSRERDGEHDKFCAEVRRNLKQKAWWKTCRRRWNWRAWYSKKSWTILTIPTKWWTISSKIFNFGWDFKNISDMNIEHSDINIDRLHSPFHCYYHHCTVVPACVFLLLQDLQEETSS